MAVVIDLEDVWLRRGTANLLEGVNLRVNEGERWVVIGPNGAGKTTLLTILAAQQHPTQGVVRLLDEQLGHVDVFELRPRIGVASSAIAQRIAGHERVRDVVVSAAYGAIRRWREHYDQLDFDRADELLRRFRIDQLAERTFGTLSEGERKRVEIARALMTDPELLLLDEPGAGLDLAGRELLVATLSRLVSDPTAPTTVLVTHHLEEIPPGITHALLLRSGKVVASGPIDSVLTSQNLSAAFDLPLSVERRDGRWSARASLLDQH